MLTLINVISLLFIAITLFVRANDLRWRKELPYKVRAVGLLIAGFLPLVILRDMLLYHMQLSAHVSEFLIGLDLVFLTTPGLPPWHVLVFGKQPVPQQ